MVTRQRIWQRRYEAKYPERYKAKMKANNEARKLSGSLKRWRLKKVYGITPEQWDAIFLKQGKKCAICDRTEVTGNRRWHVDHDHATGKIRGILCDICNRIVLPVLESYRPLISRAHRYLVENS